MKAAQDYGSFNSGASGKTLIDLYQAIRADAGLPPAEKLRLVNQLEGLTQGVPSNTPLSSLMSRGLGGVIGWLISKYFGMGVVGQALSTLAGFGLGSSLNKQINRPPPGWRKSFEFKKMLGGPYIK